MSTIHFCHEAMTTLHNNTEVMPEVMPILVFATRPRQHFIRTKAMPTFILVMKPRQHSTLALALALKSHQYLHRATSKLHLHQHRANIHEATKSRQYFICTETVPTFMKLRQNFICTETVPTFMKPRQHSTLTFALASKLHQFF